MIQLTWNLENDLIGLSLDKFYYLFGTETQNVNISESSSGQKYKNMFKVAGHHKWQDFKVAS